LAGGAVVPDGGGQGQEALGAAGSDAFDGASTVPLQTKLALRGMSTCHSSIFESANAQVIESRRGGVGPGGVAPQVGVGDQQ